MAGHVFPQHYQPRPYQAEAHVMFRKHRISGLVFPRQSGKDVTMSMEGTERCLRVPNTNAVYVSIDKPSVRNIVWDKKYPDPVLGQNIALLQDNVPKSLVRKWRGTIMEGEFTNGSKLKLDGYFQSGKEQNGVGTSFDTYMFTELSLFTKEDPIPRLTPIITSEQGDKKLMFVATPRGKRNNPLWQIMQSNEGDPDFAVLIRTIDDLNEIQRRHGLPPVRTEAQLEKDAESYLRRFGNTRMFEQEYYVSFEEMDAAAVYGEALSRLQAEHRDVPFTWSPAHPVYVVFDIGSSGVHSDATAWIAFQWINERLDLIDCGQGTGRALPEYVDDLVIKPWARQMTHIILPWDGDHHEVSIRTTPADMMRQRVSTMPVEVSVLAKGTNIWTVKGLPQTDASDIITMVQSVRLQLYNTRINGLTDEEKKRPATRPNCDELLDCMENYKFAFNNATQEWSPFPKHDKYSHLMDALRYAVQATKEINFFNGTLFNSQAPAEAVNYEEDYSGVW